MRLISLLSRLLGEHHFKISNGRVEHVFFSMRKILVDNFLSKLRYFRAKSG